MASKVSPAAPKIKMGSPQAIVAPSSANNFRTVPPSSAKSSLVSFSIAISPSTSPFETVCPSFTDQELMVPSSMVAPNLGITTLWVIFNFPVPAKKPSLRGRPSERPNIAASHNPPGPVQMEREYPTKSPAE